MLSAVAVFTVFPLLKSNTMLPRSRNDAKNSQVDNKPGGMKVFSYRFFGVVDLQQIAMFVNKTRPILSLIALLVESNDENK